MLTVKINTLGNYLNMKPSFVNSQSVHICSTQCRAFHIYYFITKKT